MIVNPGITGVFYFHQVKRFKLTLRLRIFLSMILIILISFFLTGAISFYYFKNQNNLYHQERLKRKEYAINEAIDYFLRDQPLTTHTDSIVKMFDTKICELADINSMDINIYGMNGNLLISSRPELYEKGIVPEHLEEQLLKELRGSPEQLIIKAKRDSLSYISTFDYIRNYMDKPIAVINLPYFDTENVQQRDLSDFLMRLSEIYFLLFIAAGLIAYFLSNYITGSLQTIGDMLKNTKINESNPPLKWRFDDEVGALVDEYNRMMQELENSAVKLAKTERESAWKEMAKQVAHEIKNPLTPMRLNVQYLEKSLKTENPEKLKEFTNSMISQIDTLSNIAEAFSRFASLPEMKFEEFPVKEIIKRTTGLYPDYKIEFHCEDPELQIRADKNQLVRVMNNLINNAIQSIPEGREAIIKVSVGKTGEVVNIAVEDNGSGIPTDQRDKIFEPRFTTKTKGMGLGLAMVKSIIDSFKGEIWFETEESKGTVFHIELPLTGELQPTA